MLTSEPWEPKVSQWKQLVLTFPVQSSLVSTPLSQDYQKVDLWTYEECQCGNQHAGKRTKHRLLLDFCPNLQPVPVRVVIIFRGADWCGSALRYGRSAAPTQTTWEWWSVGIWSTSMTNQLSDRLSFHLLNTEGETLSWRQEGNQRKWQTLGTKLENGLYKNLV